MFNNNIYKQYAHSEASDELRDQCQLFKAYSY